MNGMKHANWQALCATKTVLLLLLATVFVNHTALAQPSWESAVGGPNLETAHKVVRTERPSFEDGVLAVGGTDSFGARFQSNPPNLYVSYTDPTGTGAIGWALDLQTWGEDYSIVEMPDLEQFVVTTGAWNPNTGSYDIAVICLDFDENIIWSNWYGSYGRDGGTSIIRMQEGQYAGQLVVAGFYENDNGNNDGVIIRLLDDGTPQVASRFDLSSLTFNSNDRLFCVREDIIQQYGADHVYAVGASNIDNPGPKDDDLWLLHVELTATANTGVNSVVYDAAGGNDRGYSLTIGESPEFQGGWVITMVGESQYTIFPDKNDAFVVRSDFAGNVNQIGLFGISYNIPGPGDNSWDVAYSVENNLANNGGVIVVGQTNRQNEAYGDGFAMEIGNLGNVGPASTYGRTDYESIRSIAVYPGMGYYYGGITYSDGNGGGDQWISSATPFLLTGTNLESSNTCALPTSPDPGFGLNIATTVFPDVAIPSPTPPIFDIVSDGQLVEVCQGPPSPAPPPVTTDVESEIDPNNAAVGNSPNSAMFIMAPNPVAKGQEVTLRLRRTLTADASVTVSDALGRTLLLLAGADINNQSVITIATEGWSSGAYNVTISAQDEVHNASFIIND